MEEKERKKIVSEYMASLGKKSWERNKKKRDMGALGKLGGAAGKGKLRGKYKQRGTKPMQPEQILPKKENPHDTA